MVLLICGAGVVVAFQIGKAPAALPLVRADLQLSLVMSGWVISMFNVIGTLLGMIIGAMADRLGHRRVILSGLGLVALASLAGSEVGSGALLLATRFFEGLGFMMVVVAAPALIVRATDPGHLKLAFGAWGCYMPAGSALMMAVAPALLAPFGWRGLWIANGVLVAVFAAALALATRKLARPRASAPPPPILRDIGATVTAPGPILLALAFGLYALKYLVVLGFLPTILVESEGLSLTAASGLTAFAIAMNVPGNLVGGMLVHRGVKPWVLLTVASIVLTVCGSALYEPALPLWLRYLLCVVLSLVGGILPSSIFGAAPALAPSPRLVATTNGLIMQGSNLGQSIGPPTAAALAASAGDWHMTPIVLASAGLAGVAVALSLRRLERRARQG
ncbi:MAG TPA: MFS transporter [Alphaproteobacteria bacterium]|nr:MFS transporter [Alphaproteobacteria bacterium]